MRLQERGFMRAVTCLAILLFLVFPMMSLATEKAKTIDELAKMYDVSSCKECHKEIYEEWEKSMHARSLVGTGRTAALFKNTITYLMDILTKSGAKEIKDIKVEQMEWCFKCHLPQMKNATDEVAQQLAKALVEDNVESLEKVNINCLVCHNQKAIVHKWQDGEPERGVIYGSKNGLHPDRTYRTIKKSPVMKEAIACGQCHGLGPNIEFPQPSQCATLYGSYLHAYVPAGGIETCQDCHMKKENKGHLMPAYRDVEMRKRAVDVRVETLTYKFLVARGDAIPMAVIKIWITNNAGHRIPDG